MSTVSLCSSRHLNANMCVFTSHNEPKQLARVRFILGVGKNPVNVFGRGLILSLHTCVCSCSFMFKVSICFRDVVDP